VFEGGSSGVQVAKAGAMAALGVPRLNDQALLNEAGANLMVTSLYDVAVRAQNEARLDRATIR
jgi:beta-phosphoglucomutase